MGKYVLVVLPEERMGEGDVALCVFSFVKVVHIELGLTLITCLIKEERLPCLKNPPSNEVIPSSSVMAKESPAADHCRHAWLGSCSMSQTLSTNTATVSLLQYILLF